MMRKALLLLLAAVLCGSLPAQDNGTAAGAVQQPPESGHSRRAGKEVRGAA